MRRFPRSAEPSIVPFIGHVIGDRAMLSGRVLRNAGPRPSAAHDSRWRNLAGSVRLFATREVPGARLEARYGGTRAQASTDREGYFEVELAPVAPESAALWQQATLELVSPRPQSGPATFAADLLVHPPGAQFGVVSDIDDTVLASHATSKLAMFVTVLMSNAQTRLPLRGVAAFYRALQAGLDGRRNNPLFYVSNGPWNLYGVLLEFFKLNEIPLGPIQLRDFGRQMVFAPEPSGAHKLRCIDRILASFDPLPFVLIGDSGERDPEIYAEIVRRYPARIRVIYIRSVNASPQRLAAIAALADAIRGGSTQMVVVSDSEAAAVHAAGEGLIGSAAIAAVRDDRRGA